MTVKVTKKDALRLLREAVEKKGADYRDPNAREDTGCLYANGTRPGCIIGHVLYAVGVKPKVLREMDASSPNGASEVIADLDRLLADRVGVTMTPAALNVLSSAQSVQDSGRTWGEALEAAGNV